MERNYELKKHWLAHTKKICLRCNLPIIKNTPEVKTAEVFSVPTASFYTIKNITGTKSKKPPFQMVANLRLQTG